MAFSAGQSSAHIGGALSTVDIISTLYQMVFQINKKIFLMKIKIDLY